MDDRTFDDKAAKAWIETIEAESARIREQDLYPLLREWIAEAKPDRVLDLGCGQGACSAELGPENRAYVGVDPSPLLVARAKELHAESNREFLVGDAYALPLPDRSVSAFFSVAVWHLLEHPGAAAKEAARVLGPAGSFLVVSADPDSYAAWTGRYTTGELEGKKFTGTISGPGREPETDVLYLHTKEELRASLESAGLEILGIRTFRAQIAIRGQKPL